MIYRYKFSGSPGAIGLEHGKAFRGSIEAIISIFVEHPNEMWSHRRDEALAWFRHMRDKHYNEWPWLAEEIAGIAKGAGIELELIEQLNFRTWQYPLIHQGHACSSFAAKMHDGNLISGGSLDDPRWLYAFTDIAPAGGLRFMTFPICGTAWGNRGMNGAGLVLGISSQNLRGLRFDPNSIWQQDICFRLLLQTCSNCEDVLEFCRYRPFIANICAADSSGNSVVFNNGPFGLHVYQGASAITNHVLPELEDFYTRRGWDGSNDVASTYARLERLNNWIEHRDGRITLDEAKTEMARRDGWPNRTVNNPMTAFIMLAMPQRQPRSMWAASGPVTTQNFQAFDFD
jgi:hypothetical protein